MKPTHADSDSAERKRAEEALRESEERYRLLAETSEDMIYVISRDDRVEYVNSAAARALGQPPQNVIGKGRADLFPPEIAEEQWRNLQEVFESGKPLLRESRVVFPHGERWISAQLVPFRREGGKVTAVMGVSRDLTEHKQAGAALRESEDRYRVLVEESPDGIGIIQEGKLVFINVTGLRLFNAKTKDDLLGRTIGQLVHPDDLAAALDRLRRRRAGETGVYPAEVRYLRVDDTVVPVEIGAAAILYHGKPAMQFIARDITERQQAAEEIRQLNVNLDQRVRARTAELEQATIALRESEEKWRTLFDESADGMILAHPETRRFRSVNQTICRMLGYSEAELLALNVADIHPPADLPTALNAFPRQARRGEMNEAADLPMLRKDGSVFYADVGGTVVVVGGERLLLGAFRDVTERRRAAAELARHREQLEQLVGERTKELEGARAAALSLMQDAYRQQERVAEALAAQRALAAQLEDANKELESFSYSVSHDLRAPLRHIHGYVEMLERETHGQLADKPARYLKTIAAASQSMGHLIDDLLSFSRMGRAELHEARVDLDRLVQECIRNLETDTKDRPIVWKIPSLPQVTGDPSLLRQVFANLLGNAVKYTRPRDPAVIEIGTVAAEVTRLTYPESGIDQSLLTSAATVFFVRDNGVGFDPQYAHKLFGVFQRLHRAEEFEGTGIGLANVRRIIARHGGRTWAEGKPGEGATFYFTLKPANASEELTMKKAE